MFVILFLFINSNKFVTQIGHLRPGCVKWRCSAHAIFCHNVLLCKDSLRQIALSSSLRASYLS